MKKTCFCLTLALEAAALLTGAAAAGLLLRLTPEAADLRACAPVTLLLTGGCGGFYLGGKCSPRWIGAALIAAACGLALTAALLASLAPPLLAAGTLVRAGLLILAAALAGALLGAGRTEAGRLKTAREDRPSP